MFSKHIPDKGLKKQYFVSRGVVEVFLVSRGVVEVFLYVLTTLLKYERKVISILKGGSKLLEKENKCKVAKDPRRLKTKQK